MKNFIEFLGETKFKRFAVFNKNPGREYTLASQHDDFHDAHQAAKNESMENHSAMIIDNSNRDVFHYKYGNMIHHA